MQKTWLDWKKKTTKNKTKNTLANVLYLRCWRVLRHSLGTGLGIVCCLLSIVFSPGCTVIWLTTWWGPSRSRNCLTHFLVVLFPSLCIINLSSWSWILLISVVTLSISLGCGWCSSRSCRRGLCLLLVIVGIIGSPSCRVWIRSCLS